MQSSVHRDKASSIAMILETQRNVEFPHRIVDKRPRKRPRLAWDAAPLLPPPPPPPTVFELSTYVCLFVLVSKSCSFVVFVAQGPLKLDFTHCLCFPSWTILRIVLTT